MKKETYYILCFDDSTGKPQKIAREVAGYVFNDPASGLTFGARYNARVWELTELSTGLLASYRSGVRAITKRAGITAYLDEMRETIADLVKARGDVVELFATLKAAAIAEKGVI